MAHQVAGDEILRPAAQIAVEAVHLAGGAGKEHQPGLQGLPDFPEGVAQVALDVLGAPEPPQVLLAEAGHVAQMLFAVKGRAEHDAAALQHIVRQRREGAAGGGVLADALVPVPGGEHRRQGLGLPLTEQGADSGAVPAMDALVQIDIRIGEALPVPLHGDGVPGAAARAGGAAGTAGVVRQHRSAAGGRLLFRRLLFRARLVPQGGAQIVQGGLPGRPQPPVHVRPVDGVVQSGGGAGADDALRQAQAAQDAEGAGALRRGQLAGGHRREEGLLELDGEHRPVEGIRTDIAGVLEQAQEFRGARVQHAGGLGVDLLPDAAQLDHRQARLLRQTLDIGRQGARLTDAVAENIAAGAVQRRRHGGPLLRRQQQRGVQHHGDVLPRDLLHDLAALPLPDGDVGETLQIAPQLLLHALRDMGDAEGRRVGDLPPGGEGAEEHRVEPAVREDLRVPDLVAAGEDQVIGQLRAAQLLQTLEPVAGDAEIVPGKALEPLIAVPQGLVVQRRVDVRRRAAHAGGLAEQVVVLVDVIVDDLARTAQGLHRPLRGRGLQQRPIVVDMIKGDKSCLQTKDFLSVTSGP